MNRLWRNFRTNWMYWRYRNITQRRQRLQMWMSRRGKRQPAARPRRERGTAVPRYNVYGRSARSSQLAFVALVLLLTALKVLADQVFISPGIVYGIVSLILN